MRKKIFAVTIPLVLGACGQSEPAGGGVQTSTYATVEQVQQVFIETAHPYRNNTDRVWQLEGPEGTLRMTVHFARFETEWGYDYVELMDADGNVVHRLTGNHTGEEFTVEGPVVRIRFVSDQSITRWGFSIDFYRYVRDVGPHSNHRPECRAVGTRSEGWYWADTGQLIKYDQCADAGEPHCGAVGSRSEGWYADGYGLIVWDNCHLADGIGLEGDPCGPSIGVTCAEDYYCQGLPTDGRLGGTGTCRRDGTCEEVADCSAEGNSWVHVMCVGYAVCEEGQCGWRCGLPPEQGPWSWTEILVANVESDHPYANNERKTWTIHQEGAAKIRVHFSRIDLENGYDWIAIAAANQEPQYVSGHHRDFWSREFEGDTVTITLHSDYSVTDWGFRVTAIAFYEQLEPGQCNRDEDCGEGQRCVPHQCFNPYAPCYGECVAEVWDGSEGSKCDDDHPCQEGLFCKAVSDGVGTCRPETWCQPETVAADCANVIHIAVPGFWTCENHECSWVPSNIVTHGDYAASDVPMDIPDADPAGVTSTVFVGDFANCTPQVTLDVTIRHTYQSDLRVVLEDPQGNRAVVWDRDGDSHDDVILQGVAVSGLTGTSGEWKLHVADLARWDTGTIEAWTLHLRCE